MNEVISIPFKKRISGSSQRGKTLYWLRCCYGKAFEDAIIDAVWIVHSATAFAAFPETWSRVVPTVVRTRKVFEEMMALASGAPGIEKPIPGRITVQFKKALASDSDRGRILQWLVHTYGKNAVDEILYAVWLVYFPAALASSPKTIADAGLQAKRSGLVFEQKMFHALTESNPDDMAVIANRLNRTFGASPTEDPAKDLPSVALTEASEAPVPQVNESEDNDDGLDLDSEVF
jgi:hypothetical protein